MAREVQAWSPDVVHAQDSVVHDPRLPFVARLRPRRYAVTVHDPRPHPGDRVLPLPMRTAREALFGLAGVVFVHSEPLRDAMRDTFRLSPRAIEVVAHGTDALPVEPLPARPTVLFFGRLSQYKGLDVLLRAMPRVWANVPDAHLVVAGEGPLPDAPELGDERVVVHNDYVPEADVTRLFREATVVALPYVEATQSGVGSVAKAHGRPMVATRAGSLPELVADGSGLVVEPSDAGGLAGALVELLADEARAREMGLAGARTAGERTSWAAVGAATLDAYRRNRLLREG
jgi:glycosyltransferase involved in cell wall biosynthesis